MSCRASGLDCPTVPCKRAKNFLRCLNFFFFVRSISAQRLDQQDQELLGTEGLMMGAFVYLRTLLLTQIRVAAHHLDGLLMATLSEALHPHQAFHPQVKHRPDLKQAWSETWEVNSWAIQRLMDEARVIHKVFNRVEPPNHDLERALRVGYSYQQLCDKKIYQAPRRVWRAAEWHLLSEDQVRHRLLQHCAPSAYKELEQFKDMQFIEIRGGTTAGSVLKALGGSNLQASWCVPLMSDTTKLQRPSTLLGIQPRTLWSYLRWASFKTLPVENRYAYSPQVFQLFQQTDDRQAWVYAVDIMRQWLGMDPLPLPEDPGLYAIQVDLFRTTLFRVLDKIETAEDVCTVGLLVVYMLSFKENELSLLSPETRAETVMPPGSYRDLAKNGDWYFVMERVVALGLSEALKFFRAKVRLAEGDRGDRMKLVSKGGTAMYSTAVLATQKARMKPSRFVPADRKCHCSERSMALLTTLMVLEQMGPKDARQEIEIVRPKLDAMPFGLCRDSCLLFNDFPIGWQRTELGCHEIYVDSTFGVLDIDGEADVSDLYTYYSAKFSHLIQDSMHQDLAKYPPRDVPVDYMWATAEEKEKEKPLPEKKKNKRKQPEAEQQKQQSNKKQRLVQEVAIYTRQSIELGPSWDTCGSSEDIPQ